MLRSVVPFPGAFVFFVTLNTDSWYRGSGNGNIQDCCELLLTIAIMHVLRPQTTGGKVIEFCIFHEKDFSFIVSTARGK